MVSSQLQRRRLVARGRMRRDARRVWIGGLGGGASAERREREREREVGAHFCLLFPLSCGVFNSGVALLLVCGWAGPGLDRPPGLPRAAKRLASPGQECLGSAEAGGRHGRCCCCCCCLGLAGPTWSGVQDWTDWWRQYVPCYQFDCTVVGVGWCVTYFFYQVLLSFRFR